MRYSFTTMANETVGNGLGAMPALPSPLEQLEAEYTRRLSVGPTFRPLGTWRTSERDSGNSSEPRSLEAKKSEYVFEGTTIGKSASDDVITGLEASDVESVGRVPSLTDSSVFGFSDVKTSASQISICLPSQCPSEYSSDEPMSIFAWNQQRESKKNQDSVRLTESSYCMAEMNDSHLYVVRND